MSKEYISYSDKLRDPRWQRVRLEIMQRDAFTCQLCERTDRTLNVHHHYYENGRDPWDYPANSLTTMCEDCHTVESKARDIYEIKLIETLRRVLHHLGLSILITIFEEVDPATANLLCQSVFCNEHRIIDYAKQLKKKREVGPCPYIELSLQDREFWETRRAKMMSDLLKLEAITH